MMKRYLRVVLLTGCMTGSSQMIAADAQVTIAVRPAVTVARGNAQLKILVERNDRNRLLTWEIDGPNYYRSSRMELEGATAPRSWFFLVRDLPEGEYDIRATVDRSDHSQTRALRCCRECPRRVVLDIGASCTTMDEGAPYDHP